MRAVALWQKALEAQCVDALLVSQLTYLNFGRYSYNVRQCAAADLGTMTWLAMHCETDLNWICKIPRGTTAPNLLHPPAFILLQLLLFGISLMFGGLRIPSFISLPFGLLTFCLL